MGGPDQPRHRAHRERQKPLRLVVGGSDREIERGARFVPHAAVVRRHDPEPVRAGRQVGVERLPPRARVLPVAIAALEPVAEPHLLGCDEAERRVVDLQVADGWQAPRFPSPDAIGYLCRSAIICSMRTGGGSVLNEVGRIDDGDAVGRREPQAPVGRPGRVRTVAATTSVFLTPSALSSTITRTGCTGLASLPAATTHASRSARAIRTIPHDMYSQVARASSSRIAYAVSHGQAAAGGQRDNSPILQAAQPAFGRRPQRPGLIDPKVVDPTPGQAVAGRIGRLHLAAGKVGESAKGEPQPDPALRRIGDETRRRILPAEGGPWQLPHLASGPHAIETQGPVGDPQITLRVLDDGIHQPARYAADRHEPIAVQIADAVRRANPDAPPPVLEEGRDAAPGQGTVGMRCHPARVPPVQASRHSSQQYAPLSGGQDRSHDPLRHILARGQTDGSELAKAVEAAGGGHPDAAFAVFEDANDGVPGQSVRPGKHVGPSLAHVQEAAVGANPQAAIAITKEADGNGAGPEGRKGYGTFGATGQPSDAGAGLHQQGSGAVAGQYLQAAAGASPHGVACRSPGRPPPQAAFCGCPHVTIALVQGPDPSPKAAVLSVTLDASVANRAQPAGRYRRAADPYRSGPVLEEIANEHLADLRIAGQRAILPADHPARGADPQGAVASAEEASNGRRGQRRPWWRLPRPHRDAVEAKQAGLRPEPEISVLCLCERDNLRGNEALADLPRCVCVLADVERGVQRERRRRVSQQTDHHRCAEGENASWSCPPRHAAHHIDRGDDGP